MTVVALSWTPDGRRKRGRPKTTGAEDGGTGKERCRLVFMEHSTPCSLRQKPLADCCPRLVRLLGTERVS